jgi:inorganic pyrophosphatase
MPNLAKLPLWAEGGFARVVVETPRHSRGKITYDAKFECFTLSRALLVGLTYPFDFGFLPSTIGDDGDPLDALVLHGAQTFPGVSIVCRILGAMKVIQIEDGKKERNDRFIAVPAEDRGLEFPPGMQLLPRELELELQTFFSATVATENKHLTFPGWAGSEEALALIHAGEKAFIDRCNSK